MEAKISSLQQEIDGNRIEIGSLQSAGTNQMSDMSELALRQRKRNNIIIFGLPESLAEQTDATLLHGQICSLFQDLGISEPSNGLLSWFRVGKMDTGKPRPVVVRFDQPEIKTEILQKAKRLKGSCNWPSLVITHDLTKIQCLEEKNHELKLRRDAEMMSASLTSTQRQTKQWRVVGARGKRRLALLPVFGMGAGDEDGSNNNSNKKQQQQQQQQQPPAERPNNDSGKAVN